MHGSLALMGCSDDVEGGELESRGMAEDAKRGKSCRNLAAPPRKS